MEEVFRCPKCHSSQTRYRIKSDERVCYICGNVWKAEVEEENDG